MDNEVYVVALVTSSERARAAASGMPLSDLLRDIRSADNPFGSPEDQLAEMAARIRQEFNPPDLPAAFTAEHLRRLHKLETRQEISDALGCHQDEVLDTLFDSHQLVEALRQAGHTADHDAQTEDLWRELLARLPRLDVRHSVGADGWGRFMERNRWLTPVAMQRLSDAADNREWPKDASPTRILAAVVEKTQTRTQAGMRPRFDALAMIEMRRRIALLAELLRGDAMEHAEEAAALAPDLTSLARLPAWIELYERHAIAIGLRRLFTGATSVRELLAGTDITPPPVTGKPDPTGNLQVINENSYGFWRRRISFDIACAVQGEAGLQVILRCRGIPQSDYAPVRNSIHRLRGNDLSLVGKTLGERLLNTEVAQYEGIRGRLRLALHRYGAEAIQGVVLTGFQQPIAVPAPWHEHLATTSRYATSPTHDTRLPDLDRVERDLRASAGRKPIEVLT